MPTRLTGKSFSFVTPRRYTPIALHWPKLNPSARALSTESSDQYEPQAGTQGRPCWAATPPRMTAPVRSKPPVLGNEFPINESQELLDEVFDNVLGRKGHEMLPKEAMWLAVTHKSFDHGKRGYNDRLAFFGLIQTTYESIGTGTDTKVSIGQRIVNLQKSLFLASRSSATPISSRPDMYGRIPFQHPALDGVQNLLSTDSRDAQDDPRFLGERRDIALLAERYRLPRVIRWRPKCVSADRNSTLLPSAKGD